jgi:sporulation protein YlmC with PRC-barrel domain
MIVLGGAIAAAGPAYAQSSAILPDSSSTRSATQESPRSIRASQLLGVNVTTKQGESLGQVQDLIVDAETGKVELALIGKGFMAGLGERVIPLPWEAIQLQPQRDFVVNVDRERFQSAPAWSEAETDHPDYRIRIYRFFELEPRMDVGGPGLGGQQSGTGGGGSSEIAPKEESKSDPLQEVQPDDASPEPDR